MSKPKLKTYNIIAYKNGERGLVVDGIIMIFKNGRAAAWMSKGKVNWDNVDRIIQGKPEKKIFDMNSLKGRKDRNIPEEVIWERGE